MNFSVLSLLPRFTPTRLILLVAAFLILTGNVAFFEKITDVYPWAAGNIAFLFSLAIFHYSLLALLMAIFSVLIPVRIVTSLLILLTAVAGYFSDQLGIIIDGGMIRSLLETNPAEAADMMNFGFILHFLLLGVIPATLIWLVPVHQSSRLQELRYSAQSVVGAVIIIALCILPLGGHYASFFREHKDLRHYMHPTTAIYHIARFTQHVITTAEAHPFVNLSEHANTPETDSHHDLVILVVGETARADHFSLNGYQRLTNPLLAKEQHLISYSDISSCGTLTAVSVPCMFAYEGREDFDRDASEYTENALDILKRARVDILWRDNNSDSKHVATRITHQDYKTPATNPDCDSVECRDTGMLSGLQEYIDSQQNDILIVLHSMGSHGPAYFKRYPKEFEKFKPACHTLELSQCSNEEIINAYDNTILYTDYFLSKVIALLKQNTPRFETTMLYVSDHGESLGENGLYLHGLPYMIAPHEQTKVPVIAWIGDTSDLDYEKSLALKDLPNSHDALFRTLLSAFEVESDLDTNKQPSLVYLKEDIDLAQRN